MKIEIITIYLFTFLQISSYLVIRQSAFCKAIKIYNENGLPSNFNLSIAKDDKGFIWKGTFGDPAVFITNIYS
jgi:hypothetical protein